MYSYYIVYVKLQQIIFQNINTSSHQHIKNINICYPEILCSVNQINLNNFNSQVYYYVCLTFVISEKYYQLVKTLKINRSFWCMKLYQNKYENEYSLITKNLNSLAHISEDDTN